MPKSSAHDELHSYPEGRELYVMSSSPNQDSSLGMPTLPFYLHLPLSFSFTFVASRIRIIGWAVQNSVCALCSLLLLYKMLSQLGIAL